MGYKTFEDVKEIFRKVVEAIDKDRNKIAAFTFGHKTINAERLEQAICNHMCDDHPKWFGITEHEGHVLRSYVYLAAYKAGKEYVELLHKEFPEFMEPEHSGYIRDHVNPFRVELKLPLLDINGQVCNQ